LVIKSCFFRTRGDGSEPLVVVRPAAVLAEHGRGAG